MKHPETNRSPLTSLDIPVAPTENTSITQLTQWLTQKFAQYERWDNGIGKTFQILPSYSANALPGAYAAELIGFFAASEALSLRIQNVSILHVEALDQKLKSRLLYTPQGRKQLAKDFSSQERVLAEKLSSYYPSLS